MKISESEILELKEIYFRHYQIKLSDKEALDLGQRLITHFAAIAKPINVLVQLSTLNMNYE